MITVRISYISFVEQDAAGTGARVAFPKQGHVLEIFHNGVQIASGQQISLVVTDGGGAAVNLGAVVGLPMGARVLSIGDVVGGGPYSLAADAVLLAAAGPAQAILRLPGGTWTALSPISASRYKDEIWNIGGQMRELTDTVQWTIPYQNNYQYALEVDGASTPLADNDVLAFTNDDGGTNYFVPNGAGQVEISDLNYVYDMLAPAPASRPIPSTLALPPPPAAAPAPGTAVVFGGGGIPDLPLCPVTEA